MSHIIFPPPFVALAPLWWLRSCHHDPWPTSIVHLANKLVNLWPTWAIHPGIHQVNACSSKLLHARREHGLLGCPQRWRPGGTAKEMTAGEPSAPGASPNDFPAHVYNLLSRCCVAQGRYRARPIQEPCPLLRARHFHRPGLRHEGTPLYIRLSTTWPMCDGHLSILDRPFGHNGK